LRTQSSNRTTIRILASQFLIKFTRVLWSAFSMSVPLIDRMTSPSRIPDLYAGPS
jgi:hypothetical protein